MVFRVIGILYYSPGKFNSEFTPENKASQKRKERIIFPTFVVSRGKPTHSLGVPPSWGWNREISQVGIKVFQGEREMAADNQMLGQFDLVGAVMENDVLVVVGLFEGRGWDDESWRSMMIDEWWMNDVRWFGVLFA